MRDVSIVTLYITAAIVTTVVDDVVHDVTDTSPRRPVTMAVGDVTSTSCSSSVGSHSVGVNKIRRKLAYLRLACHATR